MTKTFCLWIWILAAPSLAWSQTDPPFIFEADLINWPDVEAVNTLYGNISVQVKSSGSFSDDSGDHYMANAQVTRYQSFNGKSSTSSYSLTASMTWVTPSSNKDNSPCRLTTVATVSYSGPGSPGDVALLLPPNLTVTNKLGIAHFMIDPMGISGFNFTANDSGCDTGYGSGSGFWDVDPLNLQISNMDPRIGTITSVLGTMGITGARVPLYSNQNTPFAQAALIAESSGMDDGGGSSLESDGDGGLIESGWTGGRTGGSFTTQLIDGSTVPIYNLDPDSYGSVWGDFTFPGSMTVSWNLSGSAIPPDNSLDDPCQDETGSDVGCQNQSLGESVPITGTPYFLRYSSDRVAGRTSANPVATADALGLGGWTLSIHHVFDPSLNTYCVDGSCSPPSSEPKGLFLGDGSTRSDAKVQSAVQANGNFYLTSSNGSEVYAFNSTGKHLQTLRPLTGAVVYTFGYDTAGSLISVTDAGGNITKIDRDAKENPLDIVSPFGQKTTLAVDGNGYLAGITDPGGNTVSLTNNAMGLLMGMTDANGGAYNFQYDSSGLLLQDSDPAGGSIGLARTTTNGNYTVTKTTALQTTTTYSTGFTSKAGTSTGQNLGITFPAGQQTADTQSEMSGLLSQSTSLPNGAQYQYTFGPDPRFGIQAPIDAGVTVTMGALTMTGVNTRAAVTSGAAGPFNLTSQTDTSTVNGRTYTSVFTTSDGTYRDTSPQGRTWNTTLDSKERISATQLGSLMPTTITYDSNGRPASTTQGGRATSFAYDGTGRMSSITTPVGQQTITYDGVGNPASFTWADGRTLAYTYDANRNRTSVIPPGGSAHQFAFTPVNLLASYTPPEVPGTGPTTYSYNADRQLTNVAMPDGQSISYTYDSYGRISTLAIPTETIAYTYDPTSGNLVNASISGGEQLAWTYNGWLTLSDAWSGPVTGTVARTYDNNFWETALTINGGSPLNFVHDNDGLVTTAGAETIGRRPDNGLVSQTSLGVVTDAVTYDSFGMLTGYTAQQNGAALYTSQYTFDNAGRISAKSETIGGTSNNYAYTYDVSGRLTSVMLNGSSAATYSYDSNSNRMGGTYDAQDRLLANSTGAFTYAPNGELASKTVNGETTTYTYDEIGNLIAATGSDGTSIGYIVDAKSRRVGVTVNGALTTGYLYDGTQLVAQLDGNNSVVSQFVYGTRGNVPDYMVSGGVTYRILVDQLGSPRLIVNSATGAVMEQIDYGAFGHILNDTNPGFQPFGFAGGLHDPNTGLVRFGARDYFPKTGRWTAKDPVRFAGGDTNLYAYAFNDPVNKLDSTGLVPNSLLECQSLQDLEDYGNKWIQDNYHKIPIGPATIDINNSTITVGTSATLTAEGQNVASMTAEVGVGLNTASTDPSGTIGSAFATFGASIPSLSSLPLIGKFFSGSVTASLSGGINPDIAQTFGPHMAGCGFNSNGEVTCGPQ